MADLVVPPLGESITEAVVAKWLKQVGEAVAADEPVAELETDKITVQLPSPASGALAEQRAAVGATVKVGDVIGTVKDGVVAKSTPQPAKPASAPAPAATTVQLAAAPAPAPASRPPPPSGNGQKLDKDQLLRLTPSQRVHAREAGSLPSARATGPAAAPPVDVEARLAQVDPRDEVVPMSPLRKRV